MQQKMFVVAGIAVLAVMAGWIGGGLNKPVDTIIRNEVVKELQPVIEQLGSASPDNFFHNRFFENASFGGEVIATSSTATAYTLTTKELPADRGASLLSWTVNVNTTLTSMASTSAPLVDRKSGEFYTMYFYNASSTAAATATFAAGTGVDLQEDEGETVVV